MGISLKEAVSFLKKNEYFLVIVRFILAPTQGYFISI